MTMEATSWKEPQSQLMVLVSISELRDGRSASLRGYEKSWTRRNSPGVGLGTTPKGEVRKGPMRDSRQDGEKGPVYRPWESSVEMYALTSCGCRVAEE